MFLKVNSRLKFPRRDFLRLGCVFFIFLLSASWGCSASHQAIQEKTSREWYEIGQNQMRKKKFEGAVESFLEATRLYRDASLDAEIQLALGDAYFSKKDYEDAIETYQEFLRLHPRNRRSDWAQFQIGMSHFRQMRGKDRSQEPTDRALAAFELLLRNYPRSTLVGEAKEKIVMCRRRLAEHELYVAHYYFRTDGFEAAIPRFKKVFNDYGDLGYADDALYFLGLCYLKLDEGEKAEEFWNLLIRDYPRSHYLREIGDRQG